MDSFCVVILGATGDLANKKLLPALQTLGLDDAANLPVICCGRQDFSKEEFLQHAGLSDSKKAFRESLRYLGFDLAEPPVEKFSELVKTVNETYGCGGNVLFYLSLPTTVFSSAIDFIRESGVKELGGELKIAFEKPFGTDLDSATALHKKIQSVFADDQTYLIDHYLGKDFIRNLLILRFCNRTFEQIWNKDHIDHIQIVMSETAGVGARGAFYEETGAIRDVVQNHLLQLISLTGMDCPDAIDFSSLSKAKAAFLHKLLPVAEEDLVIGQYKEGEDGVPGYREEKDVPSESETETFAALKLFVKHPLWDTVPWHIKTGKRLDKDRVDVHIVLKKTEKLVPSAGHERVLLSLKPESRITLYFHSKKPGEKRVTETKELDFCYSCGDGVDAPAAYERIIADILKGDPTIFVSWDEVFASWKFIDDLREKAKNKKLCLYPAGSDGP